jgi:hypothetical protein
VIVPGVNDMETPLPKLHMVDGEKLKNNMESMKAAGKKMPTQAPNLSGLPEGSVPTLTDLMPKAGDGKPKSKAKK